MIRPGQGYALLLSLAVLVAWLLRGASDPAWPVLATVVATAAYLRFTWQPRVPGELFPVRPVVVIPVKDNVATVAEVVRRAGAHLPVIVVDDGSTDGSGAACEGLATVLRHRVNQGKGQALLSAMRHAYAQGYTHVICLDADGQHDPDDVPAFRDAVTREPEAIWVGVRDLSGAPGVSQFGRRFSNFWIWVECGWTVGDSQCGFRAYPIAPVLSLPLGGSRYDMEVEVLTRAVWAGTPIRDIPCRVYYPPKEERVSSFRPLVDNWRISWMNARLVVGRILWPPRWIPRMRTGPRWTGRSRGSPLGWKAILVALRLTGRWPAYAMVLVVAVWFRLFSTTPSIRAYAERVPGVSILRIYVNFALSMVDRFLYLQQGPAAFDYVEEASVDPVRDAWDKPEGAILLTAHFGNPEVAGTGTRTVERRGRMRIVRFSAPGDHGVAALEGMPVLFRPKFIHINQTEGFASMTILRELRAGAIVAIHGDRSDGQKTLPVKLRGTIVQLPVGPWMLAALANVPVYIMGCFKEGIRFYRVVAEAPIRPHFDRRRPREEQLQEWVQTYAEALDRWIDRWPEQWYNFHEFFE